MRRDVVNLDLRNLLVEAYQEREALLRGAITIAPDAYEETHDTSRSGADRAFASDAEALPRNPEGHRRALAPRDDLVERWPREGPSMHGPSIAGLQIATDEERGQELRDRVRVARSPEFGDIARSVARTATKLPAVVAQNVVEAFLPSQQQRETNHDVALQRLWRRGLVLIAVFGGALGFWSVATTMSGAVIASGQFVVDGSVKKVQHPTGGVVGELLVREGDQVAEGDLLIRLDETVTRANLQVIVRQIDELTGRKARLEAERDGNDAVAVPPELTERLSDPEVARVVTAEQKLFQARRAARASHQAQLTKRITQHRNEIAGLRSQLEANGRESQIIAEELKGVRDLFAKSLTPIMRLNGLERQAVNLHGQKGQFISSIAQIEGKIAEVELQIMQIDDDLRADTQKELREVQGRIVELSERRVAAEDQLKRVELRAPSPGTVHQLAVHTVGGVIVAAEPAMLIVPNREELILEAKVMPQDRDQLHVGQKATVRLRSSNRRTTPELNGSLARIAADVTKESTASAPFYTVWVSIPKGELTRVRDLSITAGMQADVFIEIGSRSPLSYLLRPLTDQVSRAFKER
jgi:membrane fusion protein, type I secretion system